MKFNIYSDIKAFYQANYDILMRHEVQNLIPLGNIIMGNADKDRTEWRDPANWFMATITDGADNGIKLTAVMTPPFGITLYMTDNQTDSAALDCLVDGLLAENIPVSGVMTEKSLAEDFAQAYTKATGMGQRINTSLRIYELLKVNPEIPIIGKMRLVEESDMHFLPYWREAMAYDFFGTPIVIQSDAEVYRRLIDKRYIYILEDNGIPVTTAHAGRRMQNVSGIAGVYTPPYFRGKGYATSCVAQLSQLMLDKGFIRCALYTDLANPTSNSIYQKIGYTPICDSLDIKFETPQG